MPPHMKPAQPETPSDQDQLLKLFAEFRMIERQRTREGITPLEYQRWLDLMQTLEREHDRTVEVEGETRIRVRYRTEDHLLDSAAPELPEGGLFVGTPFAPEVGTEFTLVVEVGPVEEFEMPVTVLANDVNRRHTSGLLGMTVGFLGLDEKQQIRAERIGAKKKPE